MTDRLAGLRTLGAFLLSAAILAGAGVYALRGNWPWHQQRITPVTVAQLFETVDTLRRGETLSHLFARQGFAGFNMSQSAAGGIFEPRRLRPGLVFEFQRKETDSLASKVLVRLGPEQRVALHLLNDG
jgi:hypothetical protein